MPLSPRYFAFHDHQFGKPLLCWLILLGVLEYLAGNVVPFNPFHHPSFAFDKVLHFIGGIWWGIFGVALLAVGFWNSSCTRSTANRRIWIMAIGTAIIVGGVWEILQYYFPWFRDLSDIDYWDTSGDMMWDTIGGIAAGLFYQIKEYRGPDPHLFFDKK